MFYSDDIIQNFWSALPNAKVSSDQKVLSLVENTHFLGNKCYGNKIFVRECYHGLQRAMESHFSVGGRALIVTGNSGISNRHISLFDSCHFKDSPIFQASERA